MKNKVSKIIRCVENNTTSPSVMESKVTKMPVNDGASETCSFVYNRSESLDVVYECYPKLPGGHEPKPAFL